MEEMFEETSGLEIAVIGMAGQFPGARNIQEFWQLLLEGKEGLSSFTTEQLLEAGIPQQRIDQDNYVKRKGVFDGCYNFDHQFFGYSAREASLMDPQLRKFHQLVYWSLDDAGYANKTQTKKPQDSKVGIFAGAGNNPFWLVPKLSSMAHNFAENYEISSLNGREFLATRAAYKLGLTGPAITLQTACSTSLVAVHYAAQSLLAGESDIALAGGVAIYSGVDRGLADKSGYQYQEGMILSPNGTCRTFDESARGTVPADGMGMVTLKRLEDALNDGDHIYAVLKGSSVNNDGHDKAGYTAPSVGGQEQVIRQTLEVAEIEPQSIAYVEAHGTGTKLGDPIEIQALNRVYGEANRDTDNVRIGSVKTNIGHLDAAAGISGFIKAVLSVKNQTFLPSLHFNSWNPEIPHRAGPFQVQTQAETWDSPVRRAAISSFGIGGTNAHAVIENSPLTPQRGDPEKTGVELLLWSGKSSHSVNSYSDKLTEYLSLSSNPDNSAFLPEVSFADIAYSLACRKSHFTYRRAVIAANKTEAIAVLQNSHALANRETDVSGKVYAGQSVEHNQLVFLFPGQGSQYPGMAKDLYQDIPAFKQHLEQCLTVLSEVTNEQGYSDNRTFNYRDYLLNSSDTSEVFETLETRFAQPLIFSVEYALGKTLLSWGLTPDYCIGHSLGEYTCACLSGMLSLPAAMALVLQRASLMNCAPTGSMLAVNSNVNELQAILPSNVEIAAINSDNNVVVAGDSNAITSFKAALDERNIINKALATSHAFHSRSMECVLDDFQRAVEHTRFCAPELPWISTMTGEVFNKNNLPGATYWTQQIRQPVKFADSIANFAKKKVLFLEVGPGKALSSFVRNNDSFAPGRHNTAVLLESIKSQNSKNQKTEMASVNAELDLKARLYVAGVDMPWKKFFADKAQTSDFQHKYTPLPPYVFDEHDYRPDSNEVNSLDSVADLGGEQQQDGEVALVQQQWQEVSQLNDAVGTSAGDQTQVAGENTPVTGEKIILLADNSEQYHSLKAELLTRGNEVALVLPAMQSASKGDVFKSHGDRSYTLDPLSAKSWRQLATSLVDFQADRIIDIWPLSQPPLHDGVKRNLHLAQGLLATWQQPLIWNMVGKDIYSVTGDTFVDTNSAWLYPSVKVLAQESDNLTATLLDFNVSKKSRSNTQILLTDIARGENDKLLARTGKKLWRPIFNTQTSHSHVSNLKEKGTYLITGGTGGIGLALAVYLAKSYQVHLILISRHAQQFNTGADLATAEILDTLNQYAASITLRNCDVSDDSQVSALGSWLAQSQIKLDGVFHAAGVAGSGLHHNKSHVEAQQVLQPKVTGSNNLLRMLGRHQMTPDFVMLFSSITSWLGGVGQFEYAVANQYLDKLAASSDEVYPVLAMNWDTWRDVGMMSNGKSRDVHQSQWLQPVDKSENPENDTAQIQFSGELEASKVWALNEHLVYDIPTMPGATYLSLAVANLVNLKHGSASESISPEQAFPVHIKEANFMQPLSLDFNDKARLMLSAEEIRPSVDASKASNPESNWQQGYQFQLSSQNSFAQQTVHCKGTLAVLNQEFGNYSRVAEKLDLQALQQKATRTIKAQVGVSLLQQLQWDSQGKPDNDALNAIELGPRWDVLKQVYTWNSESGNVGPINNGLALFELPEACQADMDGISLHPAMLDCVTAFMRVIDKTDAYLPVAYQEMLLYKAIPAKCWSWCQQLPDKDKDNLTFKVVVCDRDGEIVATVERFLMRKVSLSKVIDEQKNEVKQRLLKEAISTDEAWSFLELALAQPDFHDVLITRKNVSNALQNDQLSMEQVTGSSDKRFPRPDLIVPFKPAKTPDQKQMTIYLEGLLGLEQVGIDDGFFDLGGNSLQLTQFHKFLSQEMRKDIDITDLFQHSSVSAIMNLLKVDQAYQEEVKMDNVKSRAEKQKAARMARRQRKQSM